MYLFARERPASSAHPAQAAADALETAAAVNRITGLDLSVWMTVFSSSVGTVVWATTVDRLSQLGAATTALSSSDAYQSLLQQIDGHFAGPPSDLVLDIVQGGPGEEAPQYTVAVRAVCANGCLEQGLAAGLDLGQRFEQVTGRPAMVGATVSGRLGEVVWLAGFPDLDALEAANAALAQDTGYRQALDAAGASFLAGTEVVTYRRLG
jgi:hypothetical protein